jgi:hypothetical protein
MHSLRVHQQTAPLAFDDRDALVLTGALWALWMLIAAVIVAYHGSLLQPPL